MDYNLPGSSVHGILQARILEWVAKPSSRGSSWPRDRTQVSRIAGRFFTTKPLGKPLPPRILLHNPINITTISVRAAQKEIKFKDFPGGPVDKTELSMQGVQVWSLAGGTKIPPVMGQLSPYTTTTQPTCSRALVPVCCNKDPVAKINNKKWKSNSVIWESTTWPQDDLTGVVIRF